jgi:septal ring factor EnvC (AmiA/AmiB activator)
MILNIIKANAEIEKLQGELAKLREEQALTDKSFTDLEAVMAEAKKETESVIASNKELQAENDKLKAEALEIEARVTKQASAKALEIVASQGALPVTNTGSSQASSDIFSQYASIQDPAKRHEFWKANKKALFDYAKTQHKPLKG